MSASARAAAAARWRWPPPIGVWSRSTPSFSVIGPEGAAAILERDAAPGRPRWPAYWRSPARDLLGLGVVDAVVPDDADELADAVSAALDEAQPGDRLRRDDAASARWIIG